MDLTRLAGRGELSTLLGESMIQTDIYFNARLLSRLSLISLTSRPDLNQSSMPIQVASMPILIRLSSCPQSM